MHPLLALLSCALLCGAVNAAASEPVPLHQPPPDAQQYLVVSTAGTHGTVQLWKSADGQRMGRLHVELRGMVWDEDETMALRTDGTVSDYQLRGISPNGDVQETFGLADGKASWKSPIDAGSKDAAAGAVYIPAGWSIGTGHVLIERLLSSSPHETALMPGGKARAEKLSSVELLVASRSQRLTAWSVTGIYGTPWVVWTDDQRQLVADLGSLALVRADLAQAVPRLQRAEDAALAQFSKRLSTQLGTRSPAIVAFKNVRAFVDGARFAQHQTVLVRNGKITAVGPAGRVAVPKTALTIDGRGKTLVPGLWDSHMHVGGDFTGASELSLGVTSVRDPGSKNERTLDRRKRWQAGALLSPRVYASSMIDGKGPRSAQVATAVTSLAQAIEAVDNAKAIGQTGVKLYGSLDPAWIAPMVARAHRLGLHVHGHIPAGMRPLQALEAGYDEITHINFVAMQAMPDEVVSQSNGMPRFLGVGRFMKDVDLAAEPMASLISAMARRKTFVDPTLVVFEGILVTRNGEIAPAYAPFVGTLPPTVERGFKQGGFEPPEGVSSTDFRASFAKLQALTLALHKAGVPVVAGTDGSGMELVRELELYVSAGMTPAQALASATIVPARLVKADARTGSIAVGKLADLVLVDGDPSQRIGDLRHTRLVLTQGRLMRADRLRAAVGVVGPPAVALFD